MNPTFIKIFNTSQTISTPTNFTNPIQKEMEATTTTINTGQKKDS